MNSKLIIMIGISGSGKSTYIKNNFPNACVCSADHYHYNKDGVYNFSVNNLHIAHMVCQDKTKQACVENKSIIIIDNTNTSMKEIKPYIKIAEEYSYEINFIKFECSVSIAVERNRHNVPENIILKQYNRLQNLKLPEQYKVTVINEISCTK